MRKGTVVTEEMICWARDIQPDSWRAAHDAARARAAAGKPMTEDEIERRARNVQDRDDIRRFVNGGNLSGSAYARMTRPELIAEINRQLQAGLYGSGRRAGLRALKRAYGTQGAEQRLYELTGKRCALKD